MADGKKKTLKLTPAKSGAQMYMSEDAKKKHRDRHWSGTAIEKGVNKATTEAMHAGKMSPRRAGVLDANTVGDMISRTLGSDKPKKYANGGMVCRGMGAAGKGGKYGKNG